MFTRVKVVDEEGGDVPAGTYGEILVSGPTVMQGYHDDPEATAKTIKDGWLYTGDIGYLDDDGDLVVIQRRHDVIISGGENIYPAEIEAVIRDYPSVSAAAVAGVPDPEWGETVAALVVGDSSLDVAALLSFSREQLAGYSYPFRRDPISPAASRERANREAASQEAANQEADNG